MSTSRYANCAPLARYDASGRLVRYLAPRILPQGSAIAGGGRTQVRPAERHRLDLVANRTLRAPTQSWRIADANDAMDPFELCERAGTILELPGSTL
ncbi:hypothetical protein [Solirubrobacter soli]|uniref:hypothetical protein n=1 Tax=Solirubrobacter soli TaxID=363832 RepID=UPI00040F4FD9|nr:hypothetical protein [Solirubrobacter soli]